MSGAAQPRRAEAGVEPAPSAGRGARAFAAMRFVVALRERLPAEDLAGWVEHLKPPLFDPEHRRVVLAGIPEPRHRDRMVQAEGAIRAALAEVWPERWSGPDARDWRVEYRVRAQPAVQQPLEFVEAVSVAEDRRFAMVPNILCRLSPFVCVPRGAGRRAFTEDAPLRIENMMGRLEYVGPRLTQHHDLVFVNLVRQARRIGERVEYRGSHRQFLDGDNCNVGGMRSKGLDGYVADLRAGRLTVEAKGGARFEGPLLLPAPSGAGRAWIVPINHAIPGMDGKGFVKLNWELYRKTSRPQVRALARYLMSHDIRPGANNSVGGVRLTLEFLASLLMSSHRELRFFRRDVGELMRELEAAEWISGWERDGDAYVVRPRRR